MTISRSDLRKSIYQQVINKQKVYYSFVNKSQQTLSIMKNQRFLIFNQSKGHLYYINEPNKLPFTIEIPLPKNNIMADINLTSIIKGTGNQFNVQFMTNKEKNQMGEWNFICQNNALSTAWVKLLHQYKENKKIQEQKKIQQMKRLEQQKKIQQLKRIQQQKRIEQSKNRQGIKKQISREKSVVYKQNPFDDSVYKPMVNSGVKQSAIINNNKPLVVNNVNNSNNESQPLGYSLTNKTLSNNPTNTPVVNNQPAINIRQPNTNISNTNTNNINNNNNSLGNSQQSQLNNSNLTINSNNNNLNNNNGIQRQPSRKQLQQSNPNSRLTFKDQIDSIIAKSKLNNNNNNNNAQNNNTNTNNNNLNNNQNTTIRRSTKPSYNRQNDWNWKFYNNPSQNIILQFQQHSIQSLKNIIKQDRLSNQPLRVYLQPQSIIIVTNFGSVQAKKIKSQFRNYHFIMQAIKSIPYGDVIGVPLTCLIQYQGLVVMVKSLIPQHAPKVQCTQQLMLQIKQLQRYTRVKNAILKKSSLYDLSNIYQTTGKRLIFINQLIQYLPVHTDQLFYGSLLRPQHILDNVNQFMQGGLGYQAIRSDMKVFQQVIQSIKKNTIQLGKQISCGDVKFTNGQQLKNIMHQRGINLKFLPLLYNQTSIKQVKKYVHSFMVAKIAKQDIMSNIVSTRSDRMKSSSSSSLSSSQKLQVQIRELIQKSIKLLVQGNSNVSNELWKQISITFKKQYGVPISNNDIHGPFFINSLMGLLKGKYNLLNCNMNKTIFKDENIISNGFVVEIGMKVKSYYRWMSEQTESLLAVCKGQNKNEVEFMGVCEMLGLKRQQIPKQLEMCRITPLLQQYMTSFVPPPQLEPNQLQHLNLYQSISLQPPTNHSLIITVNYLKWCLQYGHVHEFKMAIDQALQLIDIWLGAGNNQKGCLFQCEFYQLLSEYYFEQGSVDDSINFLKQSLGTMIRNNGLGSKKIGKGYYLLGERQMRAGKWSESQQSFMRAKQSMQTSNSTQDIMYAKTLLKLSQLYLNSNQFQQSLLYAKQSIQQFQKLQSITSKSNNNSYSKQVYDQFCIKGIQIMTRVFEIENKKNQLNKLSQLINTKYNKTKSIKVYQQLIKITLTSIINKSSIQKNKLLLSLIQKTISPTIDPFTYQNPSSIQTNLQELMTLSTHFNVMEKFITKFDTLERIVTDINGKRTIGTDTKDFINILKPIVNIVGQQYIIGLVEQRQIEE